MCALARWQLNGDRRVVVILLQIVTRKSSRYETIIDTKNWFASLLPGALLSNDNSLSCSQYDNESYRNCVRWTLHLCRSKSNYWRNYAATVWNSRFRVRVSTCNWLKIYNRKICRVKIALCWYDKLAEFYKRLDNYYIIRHYFVHRSKFVSYNLHNYIRYCIFIIKRHHIHTHACTHTRARADAVCFLKYHFCPENLGELSIHLSIRYSPYILPSVNHYSRN